MSKFERNTLIGGDIGRDLLMVFNGFQPIQSRLICCGKWLKCHINKYILHTYVTMLLLLRVPTPVLSTHFTSVPGSLCFLTFKVEVTGTPVPPPGTYEAQMRS